MNRRLMAPALVTLLLVTFPSNGALAAEPYRAAPGTTATAPGTASGVTTTARLPLAPDKPPAGYAPGAGAPQPACSKAALPGAKSTAVSPDKAAQIAHDGALVAFRPKAVKAARTIVASSLCETDLAPMDQAMTNVTEKPRRGYRLLPHQTFSAEVTITLPYDPALIPLGLTEQDVYTYFYDEESERWRALERVSIDTDAQTITSSTDHFTDFVNATLTVPDHAETVSYDPTSIKDIKAADPGAKVNLINAPQPGNRGSSGTSYPIELPPGRDGMAPGLQLQYDTEGGNGWLGVGWDLSVPSVTIDTRWGVPRYSATQETETYTLRGSQLTPVAHRGPPVARAAERVFHNRVEGQFATIVRHGSSPKTYWWEVTEKSGTRSFYGGSPETGQLAEATLADPAGNVFRWALHETRDLFGNAVRYGYDAVSDAGVAGGTVPGKELYLRTVNYTRTPTAAGAYTVTLVRNSELSGHPRRPDVVISARGGFKQVTAELLARIDITFNGALVRRYDMSYTEGAFRKTLLRSVTQRGGTGTAFNTHEFTYYDDVREAGDYNGFAAATTWQTGGDNVTAGLLDHGQASALSGSISTGVGGHLYVGFNPLAPRKQGSAGGKVGFNRSSNDGVLALVDLNGDGLPDKVFKSGNDIRVRLNTSRPDGSTGFAGSAAQVPTLPAISAETSDTTSFGAEAYLVANVFVNHATSFTENSTYFSDVNGDGLIDLVRDGQVLFNHLTPDGVPTFTPDSGDTPVRIDGGSVDPQGIVEDFDAVYQQRIDNFPLADTLRRWVAPFDGRVRVTGDVALIKDLGQPRAAYRTADGVRVAVQHNGSELWSTSINGDDYAPKQPAGVDSIEVSRGDRLYFRVQSVVDGSYDQVSWDPAIAYLDVEAAPDANNLDAHRYQAATDFTLAGRRGAALTVPADGTVRLTGDLRKLGRTTDDVTVLVLHNGNEVFSQTLGWDVTGDVPLDASLDVAAGDSIQLRVKVDSPIDVRQLSWTPAVSYTASDDLGPLVDGSGDPLIVLYPPYDVDIYPATGLTAPQSAWTAPATGTVQVSPQVSAPAGSNGTITFTVKKRGERVAKHSITISDGTASDAAFPLEVTAGDQLYFDFSVADPALALTAATVQVDGSGVPSAVHRAAAQGLLAQPYRGWTYAGYNGNRDRAGQPVVEADLAPVFDENSTYDPRTAKAYVFNPFPAEQSWKGPDELGWVKAGSMSSSRLGADAIAVPRPEDFAGARAVNRLTDADQTAVGGGVSFLSGSASTGSTSAQVDYVDLNGDRFPDVVSSGRVQYSTLTGGLEAGSRPVSGLASPRGSDATAVNVGVGGSPAAFFANGKSEVDTASKTPPRSNSTGTQMQPLGLSAGLGRGDSDPSHDLLDVNGDGLPDKVTQSGGGLSVALNLGYAFAPAEPWGTAAINDGASENGSIGASLGFNTGTYEFAGGASLTKNKSQTSQTLIDLNGDGLLDRVLPNGGGLRVGFNTGNGFAPPVPWGGALGGACRDSTSVGLAGIDWDDVRICAGNTGLGGGAYFTFGIPLCVLACYLVINPGADVNQSMSREEAAFRDIDGDGYVDHLASTDDSNLKVARNRTGRTNLLKSISRPLGATISLEYQRDGNTVNDPQSRWVLSRTTVNDGHANDGVDTQVTTYQYENGVFDRGEREFRGYAKVTERHHDAAGAVSRSVVREYRTDSYYTKGLTTRQVVLDGGGRRFNQTENTYLLRDVDTGAEPADPASPTATVFAQLVRTDQRFYEGTPDAAKSTHTTMHYDAVGNVDRTFDAGEAGEADDLATTISHSPCIRSAPVAITVTGGGNTVLRKREGTVDCATGKFTQIREVLAAGQASVSDLEYFPNGNLRRVTGPANATGQRFQYTYEYDATTATHVTRVSDSFGLSSSSTYDLRFGLAATNVDTNNNSTSYAYDEFGRTVSVTGPYETGTGTPTIRFEYHPEAGVPWALTRHLDKFRSATDTIDTAQFIDGLGRALQIKKDATIHAGPSAAATDVMVVSGRVVFDHLGRAVEESYPTTEPLGTPGVFHAAADSVQPTRTAYDVLDRQTTITLPDDTVTRTSYGFGPDRAGATQFQRAVTDANGNQKRTFRNVRQLVTGLQEFHDGQPIWTSYTYDALDQLVGVLDDHNNQSTATYDNLGRRTAVQTPDTGLTEHLYDLAGNQTGEITPNLRATGARINYDYEFNRLVAVRYPTFTGNNVTYTYGAPGAADNRAGRITRVTDESGVEERFYGKLGEAVKEVRTVATDTGQAESYTTQYTFDTFNRMQSMVYPDGEVLTYQYDSGGALRQASGVKGGRSYAYVNRLEYDKFGQRAFLAVGNGTQSSFTYNPLDRMLTNLRTGPASGGAFQNLNYTHDNVGNILTLENDVPVPPPSQDGGPSSQTFTYDDLYRLTGATGTYEYEPNKFNRYTYSQSYDSIYNVTSKQQNHEVVQPSGSPIPQHKTTYSQTYEYGGPKPHAASKIGQQSYIYDANGNQTGWTDDGNGQRRTTVWDEDNRIQSISDNGRETTYKYGSAGERVIKRGPQGETAYVNQFFSIRNRQIGTKHVFAGGMRIASKLMKRNAEEKDRYFFHPDHLGSNSYITDASGEIFRHTEYFPSGEAWVDEASNKQRTPYLFAGKELDEETGLYYFGARYYDPRTGVWQSPDPAGESYLNGSPASGVYDSANLGTYGYARQNPLNYGDARGEFLQTAPLLAAAGGAAATATAPAWVPVAIGVAGVALLAGGVYYLATQPSARDRALLEERPLPAR
ncbi:SpvB/TcaC N-terminal domain-containing protein, partial [Micromonospora sp. NPDC051296]|uniref:SpvB/TcaC N-terminal domain-containing protein n=1 Tax=Micromonospora sp. NPDC051296 TaxID=3155046 RepID=UPI00342C3614